MKEIIIDFFTFSHPNIKYVVFGTMLLSVSSSIVGCFTFLKKKALVGDVVSHAVLPGICLSFLVAGYKNPLLIIIGAFISGWISIVTMDYIVRNSKIKEDTATGLSLSVFFGVGILLLTYIQHSGNANQTGLDAFLFGKAAALVGADLYAFGTIAIIILVVVALFYKEFKLLAFDIPFAKAIGMPTRTIELLLTSITVMAVVTGIQAVGVVLMAAMLITPAAAAKFWTNRLSKMLILAAIFSAFSGFTGAFISYLKPSLPTGPWMVMVLSMIAILSFFFAPERGIAIKAIRQRRIKRQFLEENLLKTFYALKEKEGDFHAPISPDEILEKRTFSLAQLNQGLKRLKRHGFLRPDEANWRLTKDGLRKGKRIQRLHRLWELYLTEYLRIAPDHVHEDAESIEHIITPELEIKLENLLKNPSRDPHDSIIPAK
ncbi:MAG: iron chelate uptake ABC transporter family permease subunit [Cytophagales bacterium]|nr:iron chelate uptake ABC transporter family permease subunit [Cytophagales bacterium]